MLPEDEKWLLAENLRRQEKEEIEKLRRGESGKDGDFSAYFELASGGSAERLGEHAVTGEDYLASYTRQLRRLIGELKGASILDVGCGPGALTVALGEAFPGSGVLGIDISESGIEYARRRYPACRFDVVAVDEKMDLGRTFDLVHAREFYPFTRTADLDFHRQYLSALARHVAKGGALVLTLLSGRKSIASNMDALSAELVRMGLTPFRRVTVASHKIPGWLPLPLARFVTVAAQRARGRETVHFYLARRP